MANSDTTVYVNCSISDLNKVSKATVIGEFGSFSMHSGSSGPPSEEDVDDLFLAEASFN